MTGKDPTIRTGRLQLATGGLFWHETGRGETLVFLHGSWQDGLQWQPLVAALSGDFHCLAPDLLGFGESRSQPGTAHSVALQVEALAQLLQTLRISRCCLVGHSLGAWVAAQFALQYPDRIAGLALIEPEGLEPTVARSRWRLQRQLAGRFSLYAAVLQAASPLIRLLGGQNWLRQVWALRQELLRHPAACRILFRRRQAEIKGELVHYQLAQLTMPVTLLLPEPLPPSSEALGKAFVRSLPTTTLTAIAEGDTDWGLDLESTASVLKAFALKALALKVTHRQRW
ncbi:MAG TPA: alpha/beta fold hydrolase [Trichocoleus sp.]